MKILHRFTGAVLWEDDSPTMRETLEAAVRARASLNGASLNRASLNGASLIGASLDGASLDGASLIGASLNDASLNDASLIGASLIGASLNRASLNRASLNRASLDGASLNGASLNGASLDGASLNRASLDGASLNRASLIGASLPAFQLVPEEGSFIAWKAVLSERGQVLAKLEIPAEAARTSSLVGRKCRASAARVLALMLIGSGKPVDEAYSSHAGSSFVYRVGATVVPSMPFDPDIRIECTSGIHFFITRAEAESYL